jgi:hypothetical protein
MMQQGGDDCFVTFPDSMMEGCVRPKVARIDINTWLTQEPMHYDLVI